MASKKQLVQSELLTQAALTQPAAGFVSFGAKTTGLYQKLGAAVDEKLLTEADNTAAGILTKIKTVDGAGSGLDADLLDGLQASQFVRSDSVAPADLLGLVTIVKSLQLTTSWQNTTILNTQLSTGTFAISVYAYDNAVGGNYLMTYSGIVSIYAGSTNAADTDEIILQASGHSASGKRIFLRTKLNVGVMTLEISATYNATGVSEYTFKFRRLI